MAGYDTQADWFAGYSVIPTDPVTGIRLAKGARHPSWIGTPGYNPEIGLPADFRLHYHPAVFLDEAAYRKAQRLIDAGLVDALSAIVIIGGAYGWLGAALKALLPGLAAVSVDTSQYIHATKDQPPDDELILAIESMGLVHTSGMGQKLFTPFSRQEPRSSIIVLDETMSNTGSRNRVRNAILQDLQAQGSAQGRDVTRIITEEVWQIMTAQEQDLVTQASTTWGVPVTHFIDGVLI